MSKLAQVKLISPMCGPGLEDGYAQPGDVIEVPEDEARRLVDRKLAVAWPSGIAQPGPARES